MAETLDRDDILARIYAGILGKAIGVRLGAPVEPVIWTYERIRDSYGEVTGYLRDYRNFAADDDTNGPFYFIRAMRDYQLRPTAQQVAQTWLNYAADGHGMYWWGGYGTSTEHTAYANLAAGIPAPQSGSIAQNGAAIAEQIGGQIFIDSWGWVNPGNPARAAEMATVAASVAHDGDGLNGARFVAAAVAAAFTAATVAEIFDTALAQVAPGSDYARVMAAVRAFHAANPGDWRACREMLGAEFGYDRYPGVCHIIPNAGVVGLALLYGAGDLPRTVEIATMCAWDTDCNAGNAGAIIGVFQGVQPHWQKYRGPVNDTIIASGVTGALNIIDIPSFARELATLALRLDGAEVPPEWQADTTRRGVRFDFALPGATHGFCAEGLNRLRLAPTPGALAIHIDRWVRGQGGRVFWKPFYRRADFDDDRYRPMLSPVAAAGQVVQFSLRLCAADGEPHLRFVPYIRRAMSGQIDEIGAWQQISPEAMSVRFVLPDAGNEAIDEIGIKLESFGRGNLLAEVQLSDFRIDGPGHAHIDPAQEAEEWGSVSRFSFNRGYWTLQDGRISGLTATDADLWTGHPYATDMTLRTELCPMAGQSHLVTLRAEGAARFYALGFNDGKAVIMRHDFGQEVLASVDYPLQLGRNYRIEAAAKGDHLCLTIDGQLVCETRDSRFARGMCGVRIGAAGRLLVGPIDSIED